MAAHAFQLISVGSQLIESIGITRGEPRGDSRLSHLLPGTEEDPFVHLLQEFDATLGEVSWGNTPAVLVFPTREISIRRLEFPFQDPKKIVQALVFELENELLEDVSNFAYDHALIPRDDGTAEVLVYLVSRDYLQALVNVCQARNLIPVKATFSAQALTLSHPPQSNLHYYIFSGPEETYVACSSNGFFLGVANFPLDADVLKKMMGEQHQEEKHLLLHRAFNGGTHEEGATEVEEKLREILTGLCGEMMAYIEPHSLGEPFTLSLHGRFSDFLAWDPDAAALSVTEQPRLVTPRSGSRFFGALEEFLADPEEVAGVGPVNFHRHSIKIFSQIKEFKGPMLVMAILLAIVVGFFGMTSGVHISTSKARLNALEREVEKILKIHLKGNHSPSAGVALLEDKWKKEGKDGTSGDRFQPYRYETLELLKAVSDQFKKFPQLSLRSFSVTPERVTLDGNTNSYDASESLKNNLVQVQQFKGKEATVTHQRRGDKITFRITIPR